MRTPTRLWRSLETITGLLTVPAFWEACCGPDVELIRPHLRVTERQGSLYPCPKPHVGYCPRKIVDYRNGEFAAICRDPYQICERVSLIQREVLLHEVDVAGFSQMIAGPLGIRWQQPVERGDFTWAIGTSARSDTRGRPTFLILLPDSARFRSAVEQLMFNVPGPFVVVAPTNRHRSAEVQERLQSRGLVLLALEDHVAVGEDGLLVPMNSEVATSELVPTRQGDRPRLIKEFTARYNCKVKDIQEAAGVHEADYYKWLKGTIPNTYSTCVAIEKVLAEGLPSRRPRQAR